MYTLKKLKESTLFSAVFFSNLLLAFHYYLIIYINSSFLGNFFNSSQLSAIYIFGSILNLLVLLNISRLIKRFGNYFLVEFFTIFEFIAAFGLAFSKNPYLVILFFTIHQIVISLILYHLDIFLEKSTKSETETGRIRSIYLTIGNTVIIFCTISLSFLITDSQYSIVYLIASLFLLPMMLIMRIGFKNLRDSTPNDLRVFSAVKAFLNNKNIYKIFIASLLLQVFYAWMVIYIPIHMHENIGMPWSQIGLVFTIMLIPFVLIEIPAGKLADKKFGEKEMLTLGFIIAGISTALIPFITSKDFLIWSAILFSTRIGASLIEVMTETYFFKQVKSGNTDEIGLFRMTKPIAYIITPAIVVLSLAFLSYANSFFVLGIIMLLGIRYSFTLKDTK